MSWARTAVADRSLTELKRVLSTQNARKLDDVDDDGVTPLVMSVGSNQPELVRYLLKVGADPSQETEDEETPMERAEAEGYKDCVTILAKAVAEQKQDKAAPPPSGYPAELIAWASKQDDDLRRGIQLLNAQRGCIDEAAPDSGGKTALMHACEVGSLRKVRLLIGKGANKNAAANSDPAHTAIYFAMRAGQCDVVEWLKCVACVVDLLRHSNLGRRAHLQDVVLLQLHTVPLCHHRLRQGTPGRQGDHSKADPDLQ